MLSVKLVPSLRSLLFDPAELGRVAWQRRPIFDASLGTGPSRPFGPDGRC